MQTDSELILQEVNTQRCFG